MTSGSESRNSQVQLLQYNKQLQALLNQMKHKTEIYEIGLGNISKILKELPDELQFKVLTNADKLRSSFTLTAHLLIQKKALNKIEKVVEDIQTNVAYRGIFAGLSASSSKNKSNGQQQQKSAQQKSGESVKGNSRPNTVASAPATQESQITKVATAATPTSTLSIQKSVRKMPPAPPPPVITKHTVSPAVVHKLGSDTKEIQIQIEANPIEKHAMLLEKDFIFRGATITNIGKYPKMDFDQDNIFLRRRARGRPTSRIPHYSSSSKTHSSDPRRILPRRPENEFRLKEAEEMAREEDMAWQCLERVYASHHIVRDKQFHPGSTSGSFNISQILENAPVVPNSENSEPRNQNRFSRSQSVSPLQTSSKYASS